MESRVNLQFVARRERDILNLIAEGYENKEIANHLDVSVRTVEKFLDDLMRKWNLRNRSSVIDYAFEKGLINVYEILESYLQKKQLQRIKNYHG